MKKALITGITGQDGSYLAELLLEKDYEVHGIKRRASNFNTDRVDHIYQDPQVDNKRFNLHYGDSTDTSNLVCLLSDIRPDEVYNLGAQSHVAVSFESSFPSTQPTWTASGRSGYWKGSASLGWRKPAGSIRPSTSELYGLSLEVPQRETTYLYPRSPYAVAKLYAYWITVNYRESYGMYACNGILFNHESKRRGETFVTRKITCEMSRVATGLKDCLYLGNLNALSDWGQCQGLRSDAVADAAGRATGFCDHDRSPDLGP